MKSVFHHTEDLNKDMMSRPESLQHVCSSTVKEKIKVNSYTFKEHKNCRLTTKIHDGCMLMHS